MMDPRQLPASLRKQLRERPYWTTGALVALGWILGRSLPVRALIAVAGIGARAAVASAIEDVVRDRGNGTGAETEDSL